MNLLMNSPVWWAVLTAIALAVSPHLIRSAIGSGATLFMMCVGYAIPLMVIGGLSGGTIEADGKTKPMALALAAGTVLAASFWTSNKAFALPTGHASFVTGIIGAYPALVFVIGMLFTSEVRKMNFWWMALGISLTVGGVIIVSTLGQKIAP